jgi:hypothetical protein
MNGIIEVNKMLYAYIEYMKKKKRKNDILDFIGYYANNYNKYDKILSGIMDDKKFFIKMCELRGFARTAKDLNISRQAVRKRYIKYKSEEMPFPFKDIK